MKHYWFAMTLIGACSGKTDPADTGSEVDSDSDPVPDSDIPIPATPTLTAVFDPAAVVAGEVSQLDVVVENFVVIDPTASPAPESAAGEGHYHLYLDGQLFVAAWTPSVPIVTSPEDPAGDYVFRIALVDSEHNEIVPAVETEALLTIE